MSEQAVLERTARQRWARPDGPHDRTINWMRRLLPMGIGALTVFLIFSPLAKTHGEISFLLDKDTVDMAQERLRVQAATYRGQDSKGRAFVLTAGNAVQKTSKDPIVRLSDVSASIQMAEGPASIVAKNAEYDMDSETVRIVGPVTFQTADGYRMDMTDVSIGLKDRLVRSTGGVDGALPQGNIASGTMAANIRDETVSMGGGVRGSMRLGSFTAGHMDADLANRSVLLSGRAQLRIKQGAGR